MIQLTDNVVVTADQYQYIVGTPREDGVKHGKLRNPRYYTTLAGAVKGAVSQAVRKRMGEDRTWTSQT